MATIHLARLIGPKGFSRTVAVKQLHPQFFRDPQFVASFIDEARLAVRIRHANVLSPIDIVATDSELFIVMDYVNGESLAGLLDAADAPLPPTLAAAILVPVLLGLHAAHEATGERGEPLGIVHRDVSPQNIIVGQDGVARVIDFGIAKAMVRAQETEQGILKGKLGYMAPEQLLLQTVDRRTDVFTSGVVLWECLTGKRLFEGDGIAESLGLVLHGEIAAPSRSNSAIAPELDAVVLKALARNRDERFCNAIAMAEALQRSTPLAGALEMIQWVERLAGNELRRKAALVRRADSLDSEALYPLGPSSMDISSEPILSSEGSNESDPPAIEAPANPDPQHAGNGTLQWPDRNGASTPPSPDDTFAGPPVRTASLERQTSMNPVGAGPVASGDTAVALVSAHQRRPTTEKILGRWKTIVFASALALLGSTAALALVSFERDEKVAQDSSLHAPLSPRAESSLAHARPAVGDASHSTRDQTGAGSSVSAADVVARTLPPDAALAAAASAPDRPSNLAATAPAAAEAARSPAASSAASRARPRAARSGGRKPTENGAHRGGSGVRTPSKLDVAGADCQPPWTLNERHVKVFKRECLR